MASSSQITANRRNAQKSTGPRSPAGKAASRFNALKHGIDARAQCIPGESRAALDELAAEYHERFAPSTPEQRCLVDTLISCEWDLRRYRAAGAQLWQVATRKGITSGRALPLAEGFDFCEHTFMRLQRAIDAAHRNYHRALKSLQELRSKEDDSAPAPAASAPPEPPPAQPPQLAPGPKLASFRKPTPPLSTQPAGPSPIPSPVPPSPAAGSLDGSQNQNKPRWLDS